MMGWRLVAVVVMVVGACGPSVGRDDADGDGGTEEGASTNGPEQADPSHRRMCEPNDFVCETWGCKDTGIEGLYADECYKPCSTDAPGSLDDECDEPERPYCSEIPDSDYGDYNCNFDATVCLAVPQDYC